MRTAKIVVSTPPRASLSPTPAKEPRPGASPSAWNEGRGVPAEELRFADEAADEPNAGAGDDGADEPNAGGAG